MTRAILQLSGKASGDIEWKNLKYRKWTAKPLEVICQGTLSAIRYTCLLKVEAILRDNSDVGSILLRYLSANLNLGGRVFRMCSMQMSYQ